MLEIRPSLSAHIFRAFVNNRRMIARAIDYVSFTVIIFLLSLVWTTLVFSRWEYALTFSVAAALIALVTMYYIRRGHAKPYSHDRLTAELAVRGPEYLVNLLKNACKNTDTTAQFGEDYVLFDDCIMFAAFKFAVLGLNDLNNLINKAAAHERTEIYVMTRGIDRKAFILLQFYNVKVRVVKIRSIYRFLSAHNALPDLKPVKRKFSLAALSDAVFARSNLKNYFFSGAVLIAVAFLTPLKIYYLVLGSISLALALLTLTPLGRGTRSSDKILNRLK